MKIEQTKIIKIYTALQELSEITLPIKTAWVIYDITNKIKPHFDFGISEQLKAIKKHNGKIGQDGRVEFKSQADAEKYNEDMADVMQFEADIDVEPTKIELSSLNNAYTTPKTLCDLSPVITFI